MILSLETKASLMTFFCEDICKEQMAGCPNINIIKKFPQQHLKLLLIKPNGDSSPGISTLNQQGTEILKNLKIFPFTTFETPLLTSQLDIEQDWCQSGMWVTLLQQRHSQMLSATQPRIQQKNKPENQNENLSYNGFFTTTAKYLEYQIGRNFVYLELI